MKFDGNHEFGNRIAIGNVPIELQNPSPLHPNDVAAEWSSAARS